MNARLALFAKANLLFIAVLLTPFLTLASGFGVISLCLTFLAALSTAITFYVILWFISFFIGFFRRVCFTIVGIFFTFFELLLIADFFIYRIYHTHIDAMILNIAFSASALKNVDFGVYPYIALAVLILFFTILQSFVHYLLPREEKAKKLNAKINSYLIPIAFLIVFCDKITIGFANLYSKTDILDKLRVIPYYQTLTFTRFASKYFGVKPAPKPIAFQENASSSQLDYPKNPPIFNERYESENILVIMLDAVRWNMIDEEIAPNLYALKQESIVFNNHFSGGNATRFGVFSFFYGLNAPYWFSFLDRQRQSLLFDALSFRGFDIKIFAASDLNWPEFRRSVFAKINDKIADNFEGDSWQKDRAMNDAALKWLDHNLTEPFFVFIFYDAPHQFSYPQTHAKFKPDKEGDKNYLTIGEGEQNVLFNQYKNAIYYDDSLIAQIIEKLKANGSFDRTKIIVTADHGEEFYESGGFGHNHAFSKEQIKPIFFMRLPQEDPRSVDYITSHTDFLPTIMRFLGVQNPPSDYANGDDLLYPAQRREYAVIGNWNYNAIVEGSHTLVFSARPDPINGARIFDAISYKPIDGSLIDDHTQTILRVMGENRRFYK
ncbi:MAG: sulfatase-like hydrolase/transferase [Helicobacteraceae bacterium]|jgi:membrane-anchored protein YejM (alkaline phosphatase superfamily)|nr:sulfatase-like hydrolase/transferase [Helicobacteraceae bacterium]